MGGSQSSVRLQACLKDIPDSIPGHRNKACITIKGVRIFVVVVGRRSYLQFVKNVTPAKHNKAKHNRARHACIT